MSEYSKPAPTEAIAPVAQTSDPNLADSAAGDAANQPTPLRCILGAGMAGVLAFGLYRMTHAIAVTFATHPVQSTNLIVQRISAAVRTLVIGMTTLGTGVFGLAAVGLLALAIQILIRRRQASAQDTPTAPD